MPIKILPPELINKIAAGEVVERPYSVVKELIENSIDAGAVNIAVEVKNGGIDYMKITDDGRGMAKTDARLSLSRHATSKITSADDLYNIHTFGFRGEALASIAEVSVFEMQTRNQEETAGTIITQKNQIISEQEKGLPAGTSITAADLFYNIPARKKFLKTPSTEFGYILKTITDFAFIYPQINFKLVNNGRAIFNYFSNANWQKRVEEILGKDLGNNLTPISFKKEGLEISGFISLPPNILNNKSEQHFFVNNRSIKDPLISRAVNDAYVDLIPRDKAPIAIIKINVDPSLVDVNVHPRKSEVKFVNGQLIFTSLISTIKQTLLNKNNSSDNKIYYIKPAGAAANSSRPIIARPRFNNPVNFNYQPPAKPYQVQEALKFTENILQRDQGFPTGEKSTAAGGNVKKPRLIGQAANCYLIVESADKLMIIDQHAAAEGILYQKLRQQISSDKNQVKQQTLLTPLTIELPAIKTNLLTENLTLFAEIGFNIENFGNNAFIINAVPAELVNHDAKEIILGAINDLSDDLEYKKLETIDQKKLRLIKYAACRGAIKFNDQLSSAEQQKLLDEIEQYNITACAHGRPIASEITFDELNKKFAR